MFYHKETFYHKCKCLLVVAVVLILCGAPPKNVLSRQMAVTLQAGSLVFFKIVPIIITTVMIINTVQA